MFKKLNLLPSYITIEIKRENYEEILTLLDGLPKKLGMLDEGWRDNDEKNYIREGIIQINSKILKLIFNK